MAKLTADQLCVELQGITLKQMAGDITPEKAKEMSLALIYGMKDAAVPELSWNSGEACVELKCGQGKPRIFRSREALETFYSNTILDRAAELADKHWPK